MANPLDVSDDEWFARVFPIMLGLEGLKAAVGRFQATMAGTGSDLEARIALGEALWWLSSLDDVERSAKGFDSVKKWTEHRRLTETGKLLAGLVYARHKAGHLLAHVLGQTGSATASYEVLHPDGRRVPESVTFKATRQVIPTNSPTDGTYSFPGLSYNDALGRDRLYDEYVAHNEVVDILAAAVKYFEHFSLGRIGVSGVTITVQKE